jgi:GDPmannose 4,6-dehydratase
VGVSRTAVEVFGGDGTLLSSVPRPGSILQVVEHFLPEEIYYLAAEHRSSEAVQPADSAGDRAKYYSANVAPYEALLGALSLLGLQAKVFYAASSRVFEGSESPTLDERTPLAPVSNYGLAKARGIELGEEYRARGLWVTSGILFNHESHLRPRTFFSSKVILSAIEILRGSRESLEIRDLSAVTDWGYARDFIRAFQSLLAAGEPGDFIIATGENHSARTFIEFVFGRLGLNWHDYVRELGNPKLENHHLGVAQISRLVEQTGWLPSFDFEGFVTQLVSDHLESV